MTQAMGVSFEDEVSLSYERLSVSVLPVERLRAEQTGLELLRTLAVLDETTAERSYDEPRDNDLQRVEMKVNLLLDLVARLVRDQVTFPPLRRLRLSADSIELSDAADLSLNDEVRIDLVLSAKLPRSMVLYGRVIAAPLDSASRVIGLADASQVLQDAWEKFIFRQHRRMVAIQRRAMATSSG